MSGIAIRLLFCLLLAAGAHAATYTVNSNADADDGTCDATNCTLREAIQAANADGGGTIAFAIGTGTATINLATPLPDLTTPILLDAATQPGYAGVPLIRLNGVAASHCLVVRASNTTIRGLDIGQCTDGISVIADNTAIANLTFERNFIGTRLDVAPIGRRAISLDTAGTGSITGVNIGNATAAGRNVLATFGFVADSLFIGGDTSDVTVAGNLFSLADDGTPLLTAARFISDIGIYGTTGSGNITIGGTTPGARNVFGSGGGTQINVKIDSRHTNLLIEGNYFGTDPTGTIPRRATNFAVWFAGEGEGVIRGNVITAGNTAVSRGVTTTGPVTVEGNWFNYKADGSGPFPPVPAAAINDFSSAPGYTIGGPDPGDGNVIVNYATGVSVSSPGALVQGNLIGLDPTGANIAGGGTRGILTSFARIEPGTFIRDNRVAGFTTGIEIGSEALVTVDGNFIGTDATGTVARPNTNGLVISNAAGRAIVANNLISGNTTHGVLIQTTTMPVTMTGNRIGVSAAGTSLPNGGDGIRITSGNAPRNIGTPTGTPNTIAYNGGHGIGISGGTAIAIARNSIFGNTGLAIDLGINGVTANDAGDADTGPNNLQNAPVLTSATTAGPTTTILGTLHSTANTTFAIELFTNAAADPLGFGEAETLLTRFLVTTDATGSATISASTAPVAAGATISASATNTATNETSEMSNVVIASAGVVQFSAATASVGESDPSVTLTVTRTGGTGATQTVEYASANGTATAGSDYTAASGTLTFAPGEVSKTIVVPIASDAIDETNETFTLTLANVVGGHLGAPATTTITITDDDAAPSLGVSDPSVIEGNSGTTTMTFDVTLSAASGQQVTVDYTTVDGTATSGADYGARFGTLAFAPGETTRTIAITVNGDAAAEDHETMQLVLASPVNASIAGATGTGTITNDDGNPTIAIADATILEGGSGSSNAVLAVTLSNPSSFTITADWTTSANTASSGSDFTASSGTVSFAPGVTSQTILVPILGDTIVEGNESLFVELANPANASLGDVQAAVTIVDDDGSPALTISDLAVSESVGTATLTVLLAPASAQTVTVDWTLVGGIATAPEDFAAASGTLTFTPGQPAQTIDVAIAGDGVTETSETLTIALSAPANATLADGDAILTIVDDDPTPTISVNDVGIVEGATAAFNITLSNASASAVTVDYATASGTATAADHAAAGGTLTFAPGELTKIVNVLTTSDALQESDETFYFDLSNATGAVITRPRATATITDDDGTPALLIGDASAIEGDAGTIMASFTVTLAGNAAQTVTVDYATANGTATAGEDYAASTGHLIFTPGTTSRTIEVPIVGDAAVEADETFFVNITNAAGATISDNQALGTIDDDDVAPVVPTIVIADTSVTEGNAGTASLPFIVTLSAATTSTITVDYTTANGTATAGSDYAAASGTLVFVPGVTTQTITVAVAGDTLDEANETLTVQLSNGAQATGTIVDDDVMPSISIANASVTEGDSGTASLQFIVTLSAATTSTITVDYATANGTATAGSDYAAASGTLAFAPGVTTQTITVAVAGDTLDEANETLTVQLSSGAQATGTIVDDDVMPSISIANASVTEGDSGTASLNFIVTLSAATTSTITVDYTTANGTATAGSDYAAASGTLVFAPGVTTQTITIAVAGDTLDEANETLTVQLSSGAQATGTIVDDDVMPSISTADASVTEGDSGTASLNFIVTLSAATTSTITVDYTTANGTATAGSDYAAASGTLVFAPGVTTQTITVAVAGDTLEEANETLTVQLSNGAQATGTIVDDDVAPALPALSIGDARVVEGDSGTRIAAFAVSLDAPSSVAVRVDYATRGGTATAGDDFVPASGTLTFAPGVTAQTISVSVAGDTRVEPDETFTVRLSNAVDAVIRDDTGRATIVDDDERVTPVVAVADIEVTESATAASFTVTLSAAAAEPVVVTYATHDGSAHSGSDYLAATGTLTFAPGTTSHTIEVALVDDVAIEDDETFTLALSSGAQATATIRDDDGGVAAVLVIGGSGAGTNGSFFRTVLQMHNPSDAPSSGQLVIRAMGGGEPRTFGYALGARETRDLAATIDVSGFITADLIGLTGAIPRTSVRVFNDAGEQGRSGFTATFVPVSRAIAAGEGAVLIAPDDVASTRFNVGMRALGGGAAVTFTLRRANGDVVAEVTREVGANVLVQMPAGVLFGVALEDNDAIDVAVTRGAAIVYGSAIDEVTQDPSFVLAE